MKFPTAPDRWQSLLERLDAEYEKWPANERPLFPPNPSIHVSGRDDARTASAAALALVITAPARAAVTPPTRAQGHHFTRED